MLFFVSSDVTAKALAYAGECEWFGHFADAQYKAQELADMSKKPHFVYKFEQYDCVEPMLPKRKFKVYFKKVEYNPVCITTIVNVEIEAVDSSDAWHEAVRIMQGKDYQYDGIEEVEDDAKK